MHARTLPLIVGLCLTATACNRKQADGPPARAPAATSTRDQALRDWPHVDSAIRRDDAMEKRIAGIVKSMSLEQKIGQMTQPEIKMITPDEVRQYYIGSVLNGGGSWPGMDKHAAIGDWVALADRYYDASMSTDMTVKIPVIWGTDAVHGHNNVYGATTFPHNIGLGAAHDPALVEKIAAATGKAVRATGIDWLFSPAVPAVQNLRWGRTYESWSEDPKLVREYAAAYTRGLQGDFSGDDHAVATVKHFIGDGGTDNGTDQGLTSATLGELVNVHGQGYFGAIGAGAQTVMASFNSWQDTASGKDCGKMHGDKTLLTDALKQKMGFDGFIVSDWNGISQVPGCSNASCPQAINAGIDLVMVPDDWKAFIANTARQARAGDIPMARIDDAVSRILRVKLRAGLFDGRRPSQNANAGKAEAIQARELARQAVRESLVLLKNARNALPLKPGAKILVVGRNADNIPNQSGGWSLTWQGTENTNADFPNADSILAGIREAAGDASVTFRENADGVDLKGYDAVIAVIGETPYAEMVGDIQPSDTVGHSRRFPEDLAVLKAVSGKGKPVVTVLVSGRPVYANDLINLSDAFVAAWLPGTEGKGVADVLFAGKDGKPAHDFSGRLSFSWPGVACPGPRAAGKDGAKPLFASGYGLSYAKPGTLAQLPLDQAADCGVAAALAIFKMRDAPTFALHVGVGDDAQAVGQDLNASLAWPQDKPALRVRTVQVNTQQDAKEVTWLAPARFFSRNPSSNNLAAMAKADAALQFDLALMHAPGGKVAVAMTCGKDCAGRVDLTPTIKAMTAGQKRTVTIPLRCFKKQGAKLDGIDSPFGIEADAPFAASFADIRIVSGAGRQADALRCP